MFVSFSRIGCYVAVFSAVSNLRDIFHKEMSTVCLLSYVWTNIDCPEFFVSTIHLLF